MTSLKIKFLQLRMRLGLDPVARAAKRRYDDAQLQYAKDRIRMKAVQHDARAMVAAVEKGVVVPIGNGDRMLVDVKSFATDTIIARPAPGESVIDLKSRSKKTAEPVRELTTINGDGIEVQIFDPTDEAMTELMRRFEMGNVEEHHRSETFGARCENAVDGDAPTPILEWDGDEKEDPFEGIKRL